ncbi:MAG: hypothetical protein H6581_13150 [Bacteroidia bacterium]|nr:hypothetical protein [Bacteroidia bacterium]
MTDPLQEHNSAREGEKQHFLILAEAKRRGIQVVNVSPMMSANAAFLEAGERSFLLVDGIITDQTSTKFHLIADFKQLTKLLFTRLDIPSPASLLFESPDDPALAGFLQKGKKYVCKPQVGTQGIGVQMGIQTLEEVKAYWQIWQEKESLFLLEEQVQGDDLRIQVIGGKIAAACVRLPAYVTGDGHHTLLELVEKRREIMRTQNESNRLDLDELSLSLIAQQGLTLDSIPDSQQKVQLKTVANMGQGGVAIDITDKIQPIHHEWVRRIVEHYDSPYFALDLICSDLEGDPQQCAKAIEINSRAEWLHHTFSEGRQHDLARVLLDELFGKD